MATEEHPAQRVPSAAEQITAREAQEARAEAARVRLEDEVARRKASGGARTERAPDAHLDTTAARALVERLRARYPAAYQGSADDVDAASGESEADTRARLAAHVRSQAWVNSLDAARLSALAGHTLDQLDQTQYPSTLRGYVDHLHTGQILNLVLAGPVGSGKTAAAVALGSYAANQGMMVRVVRHSAYLAWLRPDGAGPDMPEWKVRARFRDADLLILDDLGAELDRNAEASRHVRDETLGLIGDRIASGKGTVVTTNEVSATLEVMLGERVMSRLQDHGRALVIKHADRRRARPGDWF